MPSSQIQPASPQNTQDSALPQYNQSSSPDMIQTVDVYNTIQSMVDQQLECVKDSSSADRSESERPTKWR